MELFPELGPNMSTGSDLEAYSVERGRPIHSFGLGRSQITVWMDRDYKSLGSIRADPIYHHIIGF
jgi:hypothetical protein